MTSPSFRAALAAAAIFGAAVCVFHPEPFPTDGDEEFQMRVVNAPAGRWETALLRDAVHPPLDYAVDRVWERVLPGSTERRVEPVVWGTLAIVVFGLLVGARAGEFAGASGAFLFAAALYRVTETRRIRPYPLAMLLLLVSLLLLERHLARGGWARLEGAFAAAVASVWTLYVAGAVLAIAAGALVIEDRLSADPDRRGRARKLVRFSPAVLAAAAVSVLPMAPLLRAAAAKHAKIAAPGFGAARLGRILSYAAYSPNAGWSFPPRAVFFGGLILATALFAAGALTALQTRGLRFLLVWAAGGVALIEVAKRAHPHWDAFRYHIPSLMALTALAAVAIDAVRKRLGQAAAILLLGAALLAAVPSYVRYYRYGIWNFSSGAGRPGKPPNDPTFADRP